MEFSKDVSDADLGPQSGDNIDDAIDRDTRKLKHILDTHAPLKTSKITIRPKHPWFNDNIKSVKIAKRKAERKLRAKHKSLRKLAHERDTSRYLTILSQIDVARAEYVARRNDLVECIAMAKSTYFKSQI